MSLRSVLAIAPLQLASTVAIPPSKRLTRVRAHGLKRLRENNPLEAFPPRVTESVPRGLHALRGRFSRISLALSRPSLLRSQCHWRSGLEACRPGTTAHLRGGPTGSPILTANPSLVHKIRGREHDISNERLRWLFADWSHRRSVRNDYGCTRRIKSGKNGERR